MGCCKILYTTVECSGNHELMMKEKSKKERMNRLQIEVFQDTDSSEYFIDITDPSKRLNVPYTIGAFNTLDEALRYVYTTLDIPKGLVEVVGVTTGEISFSLEPFSSEIPEVALKDNVIDIRSKRGKDK